jgi:hypothetical protein
VKRHALAFLKSVWQAQPLMTRGYTVVAWKTGWDENSEFRQRFLVPQDSLDEAYRNKGRDLYFCPTVFSRPHRRNEYALPSMWLHADLDEVNPLNLGELTPTLAWNTSPGRWQGLWALSKPISPEAHAKLNQKLTYYIGADRNGWPLAKVLRVPGSLSCKYDEVFRLPQPEEQGEEFDPRELWRVVRDTPVPTDREIELNLDDATLASASRLMRKVPPRIRGMIRRKYVSSDRSGHVYRVACELHEKSKLTPEEACVVLLTSPVAQEKYEGRLKAGVKGAVEKAYSQPKKKDTDRKKKPKQNGVVAGPWEEASKFIAREMKPHGWLIDGIWSSDAHGMLAGAHKAYKSLIAMDLLVSVATGTRFLNHFPVPETGHVIYIQEENKPIMVKDRLEKLIYSRKLGGFAQLNGSSLVLQRPEEIPITVRNNTGFDLTSDRDLEDLVEHVQKTKAKLVVLDPLYLMTPGIDENSAHQMTPVLANLLKIKQELDCGILLVHHYKKQDRDNPFVGEDDRISGTGAFGRWYESLLLVERGSEPQEIVIFPKHRMAPPGSKITVDFDMGDIGDLHYEPHVTVHRDEAIDFYKGLKAYIREHPGATVKELATEFGMRTETMGRRVQNSSHFRVERIAGRSPEVYVK